ncbi:c-type cytochrome [Thermomonas hydrothermalis]|jgi:cytochrome c553|uniref:Cytochrome c553 n=1 Tax=Thermomonas hydrothermalis TaxID=213588 RepID=A0A1M4XDW2_9GAMM|nr:c-type cytochrome [Thermomonas hydrothermalis]MCL6618930.1 c-type cytochrome [Thermomonas hydrothermalis]SHE91633.1 Cytochrome c553 [Thermomonas hydrothermalis]
MTKRSPILLALACTLAVSACGGPSETTPSTAAEGEHAPATTSSSAGLPKGNAQAGMELATKGGNGIAACTSCHGAEGNAPIDGMYPMIGGQYADYIEHALQAYRNGTRAGGTADVMAAQAKALSDQQIADLAAYFQSVPPRLRDLHAVD